MIWLGLAVYQTDINCRAYKNCRQSQIFFKKNVAKLLTTKDQGKKEETPLDKRRNIRYNYGCAAGAVAVPCTFNPL